MSRPIKNVEQIRALLRQMDRTVDEVRARREGGGRTDAPTIGTSNGIGHSSASAPPTPTVRPPSHFSPPSPSARPAAPSIPGPNGGYLSANGTPPSPPHGGQAGPAQRPQSPAAGQPARLKAKPKRPNDPLQDFQQRQAS
jgi:hypothetical protein